MLIYKITNLINSKIYIGQTTKSLKTRWGQHCVPGRRKTYLGSALKKYGKDSFEVKVLCRCSTKDEMNHREQYYIQLFKSLAPNGYNLNTGGQHNTISDITRQKLSLAHIGRKSSSETREKLSLLNSGVNNARYGVRLTDETKQKISNANKGKLAGNKHFNYGKKLSPETILKKSLSQKGRPSPIKGKKYTEEEKNKIWSEDRRKKRAELTVKRNYKQVIDLNSGFIYDSVKELAKSKRLVYSTLIGQLNGRSPNISGFQYV